MEMYQSGITKPKYLIAIFLQVFKYFLNNTAAAKRTGLLISPSCKRDAGPPVNSMLYLLIMNMPEKQDLIMK
jgi:hypothetical protein